MISNHTRHGGIYRRTALALALGMGFSGLAFGQATTGSIFGQVPTGNGETVLIQNTASGLTRQVPVDAAGRYSASSLPVGTYKVTLQQNGQAVDSRSNVTLNVGAGIDVSFASSATSANAKDLSTVTVSANALPSIDVSSVSSSTVITQQQLQTLPIAHSAESIALLSPGVVKGSGYFGNVVSFGGASVTENAYYVNGFNTTAMYDYTGSSYQLPYGAISQQQTYTGGYSAKYGRSDGGVINQVGSRGSNDWHFGAKVMWAPRFAESAPKNQYFPYQNVPAGYTIDNASEEGQLQRYRNKNTSWTTEYSAYAGGPLIKDRLFFFIAAEQTRSDNRSVSSEPGAVDTRSKNKENNIYTKLDWNITDSHILEFTQIADTQRNGEGTQDYFDGDTRQDTGYIGKNDINKYSTSASIAQYTGYLTDDLTLGVLYGTMTQKNPVLYPYSSSNPYLSGMAKENPAYWVDGNPITNDQTQLYAYSPSAKTHTQALRADLSYHLGDHTLELGMDNQKYTANMQGQTMSGPGYAWIYGKTGAPSSPLNATLDVGAPGQAYYVRQYKYIVATNMSANQKAWYLQDAWQINERFLLNVGLRNDHFINYNNVGKAFVDEKNQWEPRIGFSWDVNGDSSFKLYGNAGRYYLALPQSVAARAATPSTYTNEYYTYTGINPTTGAPTGLTCVKNVAGTGCAGPVSSNNELGQPIDPNVVTAKNLKAQYQDEFILGFDKTLGANWVYGANATYRHLKTAIDDICDMDRIGTKITAMGLDPNNYDYTDPGCRIFNPGLTNTFVVNSTTGGAPIDVTMTKSDWGLAQGAVRKYYALNAYLEHPFDGKWTARVDYTFSRSWGNQEGQVRSDIGQSDVSKTEDWDYASLMDGAYGYLANDRRHQIKFRGAYQFTPEWLISGTMLVQSGTPKNCLGYYGPTDTSDPAGYASPDYHWCFGQKSPPGSTGFTSWTKQLNLTLRYTPEFANKKLAFTFDVFNVFNEQKAIQIDPHSVGGMKSVSNTYNTGIYFEQPRYMRVSVSYDY